MNQQGLFDRPIFDATAGEAAAKEGIARAEQNNNMVFDLAKQRAIELGRKQGAVTADDVQAALIADGLTEFDLGNAAGSVFRNRKLWRWEGKTVKSARVSRHASLIRVWQYIGS